MFRAGCMLWYTVLCRMIGIASRHHRTPDGHEVTHSSKSTDRGDGRVWNPGQWAEAYPCRRYVFNVQCVEAGPLSSVVRAFGKSV